MTPWTKTNFRRLKDHSPQDSPVQWRMARDAMKSTELGVSRFTFDPGARSPYAHRHREQEEAYLVLDGSGRAKLDDEIVELGPWDLLRVSPPVVRAFEGGPEGLDLLCIGGRRPKDNDSERVDDFWD